MTFPFPMFVPPSLSATPATWNPADIGSGITLSNSNRTAVIATADEMARANGYKSSGKWYVEITVIVIGHAIIGIANSSLALSGGLGYAAGGHGYYKTGLFYYPNSGAGASYTNGDIIQIAFDPGDGKLWFGKNGTWQASGDPAAGTSPARSGLTGSWTVAASQFSSSCTLVGNWGQAAFAYTPPSGFAAWSA